MATLTIGTLAAGQLPPTKGTLFTASSPTKARLRLFNTNTAEETVVLYLKRSGGTSRGYGHVTLVENGFAEDLFELSVGDEIEGVTTTANKVDFIVSGVEVTA